MRPLCALFVSQPAPRNRLLIVPFCGSFVAGIWGLIVECIGLARAHETDVGRAVLAMPVAGDRLLRRRLSFDDTRSFCGLGRSSLTQQCGLPGNDSHRKKPITNCSG